MNIFPADVAQEVKECAMAAGRSTAEERFGKQGEADAQKVYWGEHAEKFKNMMDGLLSADVCHDIKMMFWYQAWRTANERKGYTSDAKRDIKQVGEIYDKIKGRRELSDELASNVHSMGWNIAWYTANTKYGYKDDATRDKANFEAAYRKIHGEVNLIAMHFNTDKAKILSEKPKVIEEKTLVNNSDIQQQMEFSFSVTEGKTETTTTQIGFKFGVKVGFEAGFFAFAGGKANYEASFEISGSQSWATAIQTGVIKTYRFPLSVPKKSTYKAKGMVHEASMEVPYELVFDFGDGKKKSITGVWKGVAVSSATYEINPA